MHIRAAPFLLGLPPVALPALLPASAVMRTTGWVTILCLACAHEKLRHVRSSAQQSSAPSSSRGACIHPAPYSVRVGVSQHYTTASGRAGLPAACAAAASRGRHVRKTGYAIMHSMHCAGEGKGMCVQTCPSILLVTSDREAAKRRNRGPSRQAGHPLGTLLGGATLRRCPAPSLPPGQARHGVAQRALADHRLRQAFLGGGEVGGHCRRGGVEGGPGGGRWDQAGGDKAGGQAQPRMQRLAWRRRASHPGGGVRPLGYPHRWQSRRSERAGRRG